METKEGSSHVEANRSSHVNKTVIDLSGMEGARDGAKFGIDDKDTSLQLEAKKQGANTSDSKTESEADTASEVKSQSNSQEEECFMELDKRHKNKIDETKAFMDMLFNNKGPSPEAIQVACQDLSNQIALATAEGAKGISITGYRDDLIQCLEKEKGSISELITYINELTAGFKLYMEEG